MYDLELRVNRQVLKTTKQSLIVTGSIKYLTVRAYFSQDWENAAKTIFFTHDDITISKVLNINNEITQNDDLQLNESGLWNVCIIGSKTNGQVITTNPIVINVISKLDIDNGIVPTPQDQTLYQKALSIANDAILKATEVQRKADNHEFDGFSPRVNIQKNSSRQYILTIEDQEGIKTAVIKEGTDGKDGTNGRDGVDGYTPRKDVDYFDGQNGFSPIVSVNNVDNGSIVSIIDANGTKSFTLRNGIDGTNGINGVNGVDGFSPIVSVQKNGSQSTISITDKSGTKTVNLKDGINGQDGTNGRDGVDGISPILSVSKEGKQATINVTDKDGTKTITLYDGADGQDGKTPVKNVDYFDGKSAYEVAVDNGFVGTQSEWLTSLQNKAEVKQFIDNVVIAQQSQPTNQYNRIWINSAERKEYIIPTYEELTVKQDVISDIDIIRDGAAKGATALQEHQPLKTINGQNLVGVGNIEIQGGSDSGGGDIVQDPNDQFGGMVVPSTFADIDKSLKLDNYAADAKATGDRIDELKDDISANTEQIDALWKLSKGQLWDIRQVECEGHAQLPSGGEYGNVDEVRGKTEQKSTNGYNIVDFTANWLLTNNTSYTANEDYSEIVMTGKKGMSYVTASIPIVGDVSGKTLYYSGTQSGGIIPQIRYTDSTGATKYAGISGNTIAIPSDSTNFYLVIRANGGVTLTEDISVTFSNIMLSLSDVPYEPYTGGIPSPSPEFSQIIKSTQSIEVRKTGKNLCKYSEFTLPVYDSWIGIDGTKEMYDTKHITQSDAYVDFIGGKKYYISASLENVNIVQGVFEDGRAKGLDMPANATSFSGYIYFNNDTRMWIRTRSIDSSKPSSGRIQIELGESSTSYEPYTEQTYTITPPRPLNAIGEYADKCDVVNGVWKWNVDSVKMGELVWGAPVSGKSTFMASINTFDLQTPRILPNLMTERYHRVPVASTNQAIVDSGDMCITAHSSFKGVFVNDSRFDTANDFKNSLGELTMLYARDNYAEEPIDPADLDFLRNLTLNEGENLYITDNHGRDVSYLMSDFIDLGKVGG